MMVVLPPFVKPDSHLVILNHFPLTKALWDLLPFASEDKAVMSMNIVEFVFYPMPEKGIIIF